MTTLKEGADEHWMKPTWHLGSSSSPALWRSMNGEIGSPNARSRSPCAKNSSITLALHWSESSLGFAGLQMSAACKAISSSSRTSFRSKCSPKPSPASFDLNLVRCSKCAFMSVPKTIPIIVSRRSRYWSSLSASAQLHSSCASSVNAVEMWWFSSTDESLYVTDSASRVVSRKVLLTPVAEVVDDGGEQRGEHVERRAV